MPDGSIVLIEAIDDCLCEAGWLVCASTDGLSEARCLVWACIEGLSEAGRLVCAGVAGLSEAGWLVCAGIDGLSEPLLRRSCIEVKVEPLLRLTGLHTAPRDGSILFLAVSGETNSRSSPKRCCVEH